MRTSVIICMYACMYVCIQSVEILLVLLSSFLFFVGDLKKAQSYLQRTADVSLCVFVSAA